MLYINISLLGISAITAIIKPDYIQKMAKYKNQEVLIVDWGIYAFTLVLLIVFRNINYPLLFCYITSFIWNYKMYKRGEINVDPKSNFFKIAQIGNLIGISEIIYYLVLNSKKVSKL
jgi:hypothetical protein